MNILKNILLCLVVVPLTLGPLMAAAAAPDYNKQIAPLLRKYCVGCHNADDREGELALDNYANVLKGGENGAVLTPKRGDLSRMIRVMTGQAKPAMPPEDNEQPKPAEIALLKSWIDAGAKGPTGAEPDPTILITPKIATTGTVRRAINALAVAPGKPLVAVARYGEVQLQTLAGKAIRKLAGQRGSVNAVTFSADGTTLAAASGEPGLFGEVRLWNVADGKLLKTFRGHRDGIYSVAISPDGKLLATGSYDQTIQLWDVASGKSLRTLKGHNGAVHALAFHPRGHILASCSDDRTVKLWSVADGRRLDTLGQSLKELYTFAFRADGRRLAAAGVDNRIRVWSISPDGKEGTNPLLHSRFAHEAAILQLAYSADGRTLVSSGEDRLIKVWNAETVTPRQLLEPQSDWAAALALGSDNQTLIVGRLDGTLKKYTLKKSVAETQGDLTPLAEVPPEVDYGTQPLVAKLPKTAEAEPNDAPQQATPLSVPGTAKGRIFAASKKSLDRDVDLFRFEAKKGDQWILETNAQRSKSPLDTKIEVLHADGRPVQRLLLRAVRDSEIEFRSVNSTSLGARLKNWEEITLNQYVYINGEVVKHFRQRRGPDSDNQFYPGTGNRFNYFDTSARSHALNQPCYVVVPYAIGTKMPNNGLPVFPIFYENDDDSRRELGSDSKLTFIAPADGTYLARVSDVRSFSGEKFTYELTIRRPQPGFKVTLSGNNPTVNAGSGKEFTVKAQRLDNFNGPIRVDISGLPPGFTATSPVVIEAGQLEARGIMMAAADAKAPTKENGITTKVVASAQIAGKKVTQNVNNLGTIKLAAKPKLLVTLLPLNEEIVPGSIPEIVIAPGTTISCRLRVERNGFKDRIKFDVNNLPHGVIVDNIGLSGVLIPAGKSERTIFLSAEGWVPGTSRLFHAVANVDGKQVSRSMRLLVQEPSKTAQIDIK